MTIASRGRARIGVLVPFTNINLEADFAMLRPPGVSFHFARLGGYDADAIPDDGQMAALGTASLDSVEATRCTTCARGSIARPKRSTPPEGGGAAALTQRAAASGLLWVVSAQALAAAAWRLVGRRSTAKSSVAGAR